MVDVDATELFIVDVNQTELSTGQRSVSDVDRRRPLLLMFSSRPEPEHTYGDVIFLIKYVISHFKAGVA